MNHLAFALLVVVCCMLLFNIYVHTPLVNAEGMILKKEVNTKTVYICGHGSSVTVRLVNL